MERFFRSFKSEWAPTTGFRSFNDASAGVWGYIAGYHS